MGKLKSQNLWCIYVLCCKNSYLYIGITNNLTKRLAAHEKGTGSKFVRSQRPFKLLKAIYCKDESKARRLECSLKKLKRRDKFEALGVEYFEVRRKQPLS